MKNNFFKSFVILLITTCGSKLLSIIARVLLARNLSSEGLGLYLLVLPTLSLLITFAQMGIPNAVFKLTADKNYNNKKVIISGLTLSLFNSIIIMIVIILLAPFIANNLLKNPDTLLSLYSLALFIPLAATNNIIRNYLLGKEKIISPGFSQIVEEIVRIIAMLCIFHYLPELPLHKKVALAYIAMCFGEIASTIFMSMTSNLTSKLRGIKNDKIKEMLLYKDILNISLPVTGGQLLNSLSNFLQPIILTQSMMRLSYDATYIQEHYGIINGYVLSVLMIPSFISNVIYRVVLPRFTKQISTGNMEKIKSEFVYTLLVSLCLGIPFSIMFYCFPELVLKLFYSTTKGATILKYCAIPFLVTYLQTPISAFLHALGKNKIMFVISLIQNILIISILYLLIPIYQVNALAISLLAGLIFTTFISGCFCFYYLFFKKK